MSKFSSYCKLAAVAALFVMGCKREAPDFNNQIINKPYSLYVVDSFGEVSVTNDGEKFQTLFSPNGEPGRAIATSGENVIWAQRTNAFWAPDSGDVTKLQFNPIRMAISAVAFNQSMIQDVRDQNVIYMASNLGRGVIVSNENGKDNSWKIDNSWDVNITGDILITSFTQLDNGKVMAYDYLHNRIFNKTGVNGVWNEEVINGLPNTGKFFISHIQNRVVAADSTGINGAFYSDDLGKNWNAYSGLPTGAQVLCMEPAFRQTLLIGTAGHGVYRLPLNSTTFEAANTGIDRDASIRGIAAKSNYYKNDKVMEYVYIATTKGLYRSQDVGRSWFLSFYEKKHGFVLAY